MLMLEPGVETASDEPLELASRHRSPRSKAEARRPAAA
jgi:hypothetical protein